MACAWPADSPLEPLRGGHPTGDSFWARLFLALAFAALASYALGLWLARGRAPSLWAAAVLAVTIQLTPLFAPLLLSTDAWSYWAYGTIARVHGNPYRDTPNEFPQIPGYDEMGEDWRDTTSVYGPAFTLASEPLDALAGSDEDVAAWTYKILGAAAVLAAASLAARVSRRRAYALAFVGWNPLLAIHFAGGGHNDAWMAALVVAALASGAAGRRHRAGAAWALAIFVKWIPVVFLALRALEARATGRRVGHAAFAATTAAVAALATARYGLHWLGAFGPIARNANEESSFALPHRLQDAGAPRWLAVGAAVAVFAAGFAWLAREALRGRARLALAACLLLVVTPWLVPWYVVWAVPLAAAEDDPAAQAASLALCAYLLPQTVPL